jgi:uncharacterized protein YndB with AHSA1/START domain
MMRLTFSISIHASSERVWQVLWDDATYRQWTSVFSETSHAEGDWQEGGQIRFLDGQGRGMLSRIARLIPHELMSFEHLGEIRDGVEHVGRWSGFMEIYRLVPNASGTTLQVEVDTEADYSEMFRDLFPKALQKVKVLAE